VTALSARLQRLERQQAPCAGCAEAGPLLRWQGDGDPPAPPACPACGRPQAVPAVQEVLVTRREGELVFIEPDWARYVPPSEVAELVHAAGDQDLWRDARAAAKARRAAGEPAYYHTPGERHR
jgi:hypothetical protein